MFHAGERAFQRALGIEERMAEHGGRAIRNFMPEQHREFFRQLPFIVTGAVDETGQPWASLLSGPPGFVDTPDDTTLTIAASDPLLQAGRPVGLLGIQQHTRRRNRANGMITAATERGLTVAVRESFGNCPRYIVPRDTRWLNHAVAAREVSPTDLPMVAEADTLFLASSDGGDRVDVSHRGGAAGFVAVEGNVLTMPDYSGNNYFMSLGNLLINPRAGLLFIDFTTGDRLQLAANAEIDENRSVRFTVTKARRWISSS
jgi:predicted pyridoxine 5'-phosphate oxidase superfamily flavin-nucleotide-binding protein